MIYNQKASLSSFVQTSGCQGGCSICPVNNKNLCLSTCDYNCYISNNQCQPCSSSCQTFGCVRNDTKCNLCYDQLCYQCNSFYAGCSACITNAYLLPNQTCACNKNYAWDSYLEICRACSSQCKTCDGGGFLGCSLCNSNYYLLSGLCVSFCPTGYYISNGACVLTGSSRIMNLILNSIQAVIYDTASGIPVITGTSGLEFYPNYQINDPYATIYRGFYFTGASFMNFAPFSNYYKPFLNFAPVTYIAL